MGEVFSTDKPDSLADRLDSFEKQVGIVVSIGGRNETSAFLSSVGNSISGP